MKRLEESCHKICDRLAEKENPEACAQERRIMGEECLKWIADVWK